MKQITMSQIKVLKTATVYQDGTHTVPSGTHNRRKEVALRTHTHAHAVAQQVDVKRPGHLSFANLLPNYGNGPPWRNYSQYIDFYIETYKPQVSTCYAML